MTNKLKQLKDNDPWYEDGLRFECTGCGQCCTGAPGYIWVNEEEILAIIAALDMDLQTFSDRHLRKINGRYSLREDPISFDCTFLKDNKCTIYQTRPTQCRTFPWWPRMLKSKKDWMEASKRCEGISMRAPTVPLEIIQEQLNLQLAEKPLEL